MATRSSPVTRSRFRSPDGKIVLYRALGSSSATHAIFCKCPKRPGWYLEKGYDTREAAEEAISTIDPAWVTDIDYMIVEREPL